MLRIASITAPFKFRETPYITGVFYTRKRPLRRSATSQLSRKIVPSLGMAAALITIEHSPQKKMIASNMKEIIAPARMGMIGVMGSWLYDRIVRVSSDVFITQRICSSS
jgi:hypothetical protein